MNNGLAIAEIRGIMRRIRRDAVSGAMPPHEIAIGCLERLREVGRRHGIAGCSDEEIDAAIAKFRDAAREITTTN